MKNPIILAARLARKREALNEVDASVEELNSQINEQTEAIDDVETDEDLDAVEATVEELQSKLNAKNEEKTQLEEDIKNIEEEIDKNNEDLPKEGERKMDNEKAELREMKQGINGYVKTKGEQRVGFTSVEGGALIPEEILTPQKALENVVNLEQYINTVSVNSGSGKYPVIKHSGGRMNSVAELEKNPELSKPAITDVTWDIETYRGYIPVSQEVIDDANYDITGLIAEEINQQELNTKNFFIAEALKAATPKAVTGLDGMKQLKNVDIEQVYDVKYYISASLYNALDLLKDANGRYLLQDDITSPSGKAISGNQVIVLDDTVIGNAKGDLVGFVGDAKRAVTLFDRKRSSVKWVDNDIYGQLLAGFVRFDVQTVDNSAGFYITYTPEVETV